MSRVCTLPALYSCTAACTRSERSGVGRPSGVSPAPNTIAVSAGGIRAGSSYLAPLVTSATYSAGPTIASTTIASSTTTAVRQPRSRRPPRRDSRSPLCCIVSFRSCYALVLLVWRECGLGGERASTLGLGGTLHATYQNRAIQSEAMQVAGSRPGLDV